MRYIHGLILWSINYRWSKTHRQFETWQYRHLDTTRSNQIAYKIAAFTKLGQR